MIIVHGYLGAPSAALEADVARATLVVGGQRQLDALRVPETRRVVLGKIDAAVAALRALPPDTLGVVIASGDPLFYGIGKRLIAEGLEPVVHPAPTSAAVAFARAGIAWDDARVVSAHAGEIDAAIAAIADADKAAVLTAPGKGLAQLAAAYPERSFVLAERLGEIDERIRRLDAATARELADVAEPNVVLVLRSPAGGAKDDATGSRAGVPQPAAPRPHRIGQVTNSPVARRHADQIDRGLGERTHRYDGDLKESLRRAWEECDLVVSHLALGATTRLIAPWLADKRTDPGVVVVDEAGRFAVPLVGGHVGGANALARRIGDILGGTAILTTATDATNLPALDLLGWPYTGDVAAVTQAIINGEPVRVDRDAPWPLPAFPANVQPAAGDAVARIWVTDTDDTGRTDDTAKETADAPSARSLPTVVLHPPSLVVGVGCNKDTPREELLDLVDTTLRAAGLARESLVALTSHELKAGELGLVQLAHELRIPFVTYPADVLAASDVPTPSAAVAAHVGTPSVCEASVVAHGAVVVVPKRKSANATIALGRIPARGRLAVIGLGPGARDLLTPRAVQAIRTSTSLIGYGPYVSQVRDLARPGTHISAQKMGTEAQRTADAIARAKAGENVALVCSGDPSMYAMASPVLEQDTTGIDVEIVPGITAALAASAILGAPLGHDNCTISLSDLHTSWDVIERRLQAAAEGDFVVSLYNPRSRSRRMHLPRALEILGAHRPPSTPVAIVHQATRRGETVTMATLADFDVDLVDMNSIVIVGSSRSRYVATGAGERRIVTPRDYHWLDSESEHA